MAFVPHFSVCNQCILEQLKYVFQHTNDSHNIKTIVTEEELVSSEIVSFMY